MLEGGEYYNAEIFDLRSDDRWRMELRRDGAWTVESLFKECYED